MGPRKGPKKTPDNGKKKPSKKTESSEEKHRKRRLEQAKFLIPSPNKTSKYKLFQLMSTPHLLFFSLSNTTKLHRYLHFITFHNYFILSSGIYIFVIYFPLFIAESPFSPLGGVKLKKLTTLSSMQANGMPTSSKKTHGRKCLTYDSPSGSKSRTL